jgi:hypothetical protein
MLDDLHRMIGATLLGELDARCVELAGAHLAALPPDQQRLCLKRIHAELGRALAVPHCVPSAI